MTISSILESAMILNKFKSSGFTLIEVMIVVAIVGILSAVAVPSYTSYIIKTKQSDAKDKLSEVMYQMNRYSLRNRKFTLDIGDVGYEDDSSGDVESNEQLYVISASTCTGVVIDRCVKLTATPKSGNSQVGTGNFTLDSRGEKEFTGTIGGWGGNH